MHKDLREQVTQPNKLRGILTACGASCSDTNHSRSEAAGSSLRENFLSRDKATVSAVDIGGVLFILFSSELLFFCISASVNDQNDSI